MKAQRQRALPKLAWSDVPYLLAVCETGSLAGAARLLGVNHSTVFRRVEGAEAALGVRLFERQRGGYAMTAAGEWFQRRAGPLCEGMNAIETTLSGLVQLPHYGTAGLYNTTYNTMYVQC